MNRPIVPLILILLLVGSVAFGAWQYSENQRLQTERDQLRSQLDETAAKLRETQEEQTRLREELNQTRTQVTQLEGKITDLEANITALQRELEYQQADIQRRTGAITIGLSFLWMPSIQHFHVHMKEIIHELNRIWDHADVYFFIYHNVIWSKAPEYTFKSQHCPDWIYNAKAMYPGPDVPILIVAGLPLFDKKMVDGIACSSQVIAVEVSPLSRIGAVLLTHELLHLFGFSDEELHSTEGLSVFETVVINSETSRIQSAAARFRMSLPDEFS